MQIRTMQARDWPAIARIYSAGMATGMATFETRVPDYETWDLQHLPFGRLVGWQNGELSGWSALSPVSRRPVYSGVAEVSIYVMPEKSGMGLGSELLRELILCSEAHGIWTLQSSVFPTNQGSIRLHEKSGFRKIGYRERIAKRDGQWQDNILFERRSAVVGLP